MSVRQFTCAACQRCFLSDRDDDEAVAEMKLIHSKAVEAGDCSVVCDDCHRDFMAWYRQKH